jgi:hypothetical protein
VNNNGDNDEMKRWLRGEHGSLHTNFLVGDGTSGLVVLAVRRASPEGEEGELDVEDDMMATQEEINFVKIENREGGKKF